MKRDHKSEVFPKQTPFSNPSHFICAGGFLRKRWIFLPQLNRQVSTPFSISFQVAEMVLITIYKYVRQSCE